MTSNQARHAPIQLPTIIEVRLFGTRRHSGTVPGTVPGFSGDGDAPDGDAPPSPSPICPESGTLPRPRPRFPSGGPRPGDSAQPPWGELSTTARPRWHVSGRAHLGSSLSWTSPWGRSDLEPHARREAGALESQDPLYFKSDAGQMPRV
jgi:hypothetical protein